MINITITTHSLTFNEPFTIAYESVDTATIIIIKLTDEQGRIGLGSASPDPEVSGETIESVLAILRNKLTPHFFRYPFKFRYKYHELIQQTFVGFPSAAHAIEEAYLNLYCNQTGINLTQLFGGYRSHAPFMVTLGIDTAQKTLASTKSYINQGFHFFKLKVGLDYKEDLERIKLLRTELPPDIVFALDANQGYTLAQATAFVKKAYQYGIEFLEQPLKIKQFDDLTALKKICPIPIMADEDAVTNEDVYRLLSHDLVDGINSKLMKCGGPTEFIKLFHLTKRFKKKIMIGCMYESAISITTGAALALALPIDYIDLDGGDFSYTNDPVTSGVTIADGTISLSDQKLALIS